MRRKLVAPLVGGLLLLTGRSALGAILIGLASFSGTNGDFPVSRLVFDTAGNLYGTTTAGGANGDGTIFKLPAGSSTIQTLASFNGTNGSDPRGGLIFDAAGNLYGTTNSGGANGFGTVFKLAAGSNSLTTLASFNFTNGANPRCDLIADAAGNFYGTTTGGGAYRVGTIFKLDAATNEIVTLAPFTDTTGQFPMAGLTADAAGNFYGTTTYGGIREKGTVFKLSAGSGTIATLAYFNDSTGRNPSAGVVADSMGNLYGTTRLGGPNDVGTIFGLPNGSSTIATLATFNYANGAYPVAGLIVDGAGNLFGTTVSGGENTSGTVFELAAGSKAITTLASLSGTTGTNGAEPHAALITDASGNLYGTASEGGKFSAGTIFKVAIIPEPSAMAMALTAGATGLILFRRRRRLTPIQA